MTPRWLPALALVPGLMLAQESQTPPSEEHLAPTPDAPIAPEPGAAPEAAPAPDDSVTPPPADSPMQRFQLDPSFSSMEANPPPGDATAPPAQAPSRDSQAVTPSGPPQ